AGMSGDPSADARSALLQGLDPSQLAAVTSPGAPLCILAGAGSGKTRVLTRRIAWRIGQDDAHPGHVLALTFTRKAAGELSDRLRSLGVRYRVAAGTFHAVAYAQLRRRWADRGTAEPTVLDRKVRVLARLGARLEATGVQPADAAGEIEWAKARLLRPDDYEQGVADSDHHPPVPAHVMADIYRRYEEEKRRRGLIDFDDLLLECALALEEDPGFAAAQRWRFRHLFVDEFQDVNPAQFRLLRAWLGPRSDLCVVGDPHQAIYSWNGADPTLLADFPRHFPGSTVVDLADNYRSSPQILAVAGAVLAGPRRRSASTVRAHRPPGPVPTIAAYPDDEAEAVAIARLARDAHRPGSPWSDQAVLTRTNAQLTLIQEAMQRAGVPCRTAGQAGLLDRPEVRRALDDLTGAGTSRALEVWLADLRARAAGADDETEDEDVRLAFGALARLAGQYLSIDADPAPAGFRRWVQAVLAADSSSDHADAVTLTTFHRAKGLEWPVVFIAGLERGLVPIGRATDPATEAEERRLLYVALTRAERRLHCSWAERRTIGGRPLARTPSPYLVAVEDACTALTGVPAADPAGGLSAARRRLEETGRAGRRPVPGVRPADAIESSADPLVLAALRKWRADAARASGVPPHVIFHDATLATLASACPRSPEELVALPGLGPVKATRYGAALLEVLDRHRASA
ncbi:MAG TPA: ATP-dependent DNA helicase UvrD2, partial [Acidimicrobiales bacterium]|nr:ATP-dependent DNA helicase UvrD2 [Acidimicrobiales bacterium]